MNRRELVRYAAGGVLAAGLGSAPAGAEASGAGTADGFHFLVVNDTHYQDEKCGRWLEGAVRQMKAHPEKPEFCLMLGDLVETGTRGPLEAMKGLLDGLGLPYYTVPGNHDYGPADDRSAYDALFPGRLNYHFEHRGWRFAGLDTSDGVRYQGTAVGATTLRWLDETLPALDRKQPLVLFTHFPLGAGVTYRPTNADSLLARVREHNVRAVFSGHFHGLTERQSGVITLTTNRCCALSRKNHDGSQEKGYFLCRATPDGAITRRFVEVK
jgi:3',5'-cyclic AMP phosphodiesterase CpdA